MKNFLFFLLLFGLPVFAETAGWNGAEVSTDSAVLNSAAVVTNIGGTTTANASTTINGTGTKFNSSLKVGDRISLSDAASTYAVVSSIASDLQLTVDSALGSAGCSGGCTINKKTHIFSGFDNGGTLQFLVRDDGKLYCANPTANKALTIDANGYLASSITTATELTYVHGVTSALQTQLGTKLDTIGSFSSSSIANGGSISGTTLTLGVSDGTNPGMVSTTSQTIAGVKTFSSAPVLSGNTAHGAVVLDSSKAVTTVAPGSNGNVLTSNGTDWTSAAAAGGGGDVLSSASNTYTNGPQNLGTQVLTTRITNDTGTGTTANKLAKMSAGKAVLAATSDTSDELGIVVAGAGSSGSCDIAIAGQPTCVFDGATTQGDYVSISSTTAGDCHDAGSSYPTSGQVLGRVLSTNGSGGTYAVLIGTAGGATQLVGANRALSNLASLAINTDLLWSSSGYKIGPTNGLVINSNAGSGRLVCDSGNVATGSNCTVSNNLAINGQLNLSVDRQSATNGGSYTIPAATSVLLLHNAGIGSFTVTFTAGPSPSRSVSITCDNTITTFTLSGNSGQTVVGAPTTCVAGNSFRYIWDGSDSQWVPW